MKTDLERYESLFKLPFSRNSESLKIATCPTITYLSASHFNDFIVASRNIIMLKQC
jgi:hypothetical protein